MTHRQTMKAFALLWLQRLYRGACFGFRALSIILGRIGAIVHVVTMLMWNATKYVALYPLGLMAGVALVLNPTILMKQPDVQLISGLYAKYGLALRDVPSGQVRTFVCESAPSDISVPSVVCENPREELVPLATAIQAEANALRTFYLIATVFTLSLGFGGELIRRIGACSQRVVHLAITTASSRRID
jgi:hypothetical protein